MHERKPAVAQRKAGRETKAETDRPEKQMDEPK